MGRPSRARLGAGGILWLTSAQFFLAQALAQRSWKGSEPYSLRHSWISDLGAATCGSYSGGGGIVVCSPRRDLLNGSLYLFAGQILLGAILLRPELVRARLSDSAFGLLVASGVAVAFLGTFPEDTGKPWHSIAATVNFVAAGLAMIFAGLALRRERRRLPSYVSLLLGGVSLGGAVLAAGKFGLGIGRGGVERLTAWPFTLWMTIIGAAVIASLAARRHAGGSNRD